MLRVAPPSPRVESIWEVTDCATAAAAGHCTLADLSPHYVRSVTTHRLLRLLDSEPPSQQFDSPFTTDPAWNWFWAE